VQQTGHAGTPFIWFFYFASICPCNIDRSAIAYKIAVLPMGLTNLANKQPFWERKKQKQSKKQNGWNPWIRIQTPP
jgi:hypothetical protein